MLKFAAISLIFALAAAVQYPQCDEVRIQWFPNQLDCSKYFLCHHGNAIERSCAPGLHFNNQTGQCMIPALASCQTVCPSEDDPLNPIFLPDTSDCAKFYICYNGQPIHRSCAEGLLFDTQNDWCNFEHLVDCEQRGVGDDTESPETLEETTSTTVRTTTKNPDVFEDCPLELGPFYYPHSISCVKYFECYMGIAYLKFCTGGEEYDQFEKRCTPKADCYARNPTTTVDYN